MKIPNVYIERIRGLGYTEDEARFLYIVANHSSYFVPGLISRTSIAKLQRPKDCCTLILFPLSP